VLPVGTSKTYSELVSVLPLIVTSPSTVPPDIMDNLSQPICLISNGNVLPDVYIVYIFASAVFKATSPIVKPLNGGILSGTFDLFSKNVFFLFAICTAFIFTPLYKGFYLFLNIN